MNNKPLVLIVIALYLILLSLVGGSLSMTFPDILSNLPTGGTIGLSFFDSVFAFLTVLYTFSIEGIPYLVTLFFVYIPSIVVILITIEYIIEFLKIIL